MARKPPPANSARAKFAVLLAKFLTGGVRPATANGEPWTYAEFAREVVSSRVKDDPSVSASSVSNWCRGLALPTQIGPIERALFGPSTSNRHEQERNALRDAFRMARAELINRDKQVPAAPRWISTDDETLAIDHGARPTDRQAAAKTSQQQLQLALREMAQELSEASARLANSPVWASLPTTSAKFYAVMADDPLKMPKRLGLAYPLMLRLGQFLATDTRVQRDPSSADGPLDPDIHGLLTTLVRTAAPWLREFPTVARWDDEAGKALVRADLFQPAREFVHIAHAHQMISTYDENEMNLLAEVANAADYQGQKAGSRAVGGATNLMIAMAGAVARSQPHSVGQPATRSLLAQRAESALAAAQSQVEQLAATRSEDVRQALWGLVNDLSSANFAKTEITTSGFEIDVNEVFVNIEEQAKGMILAGHAPPMVWSPFILELDFSTERQPLDLGLLASLTALQTLRLARTQVSDMTPLASLTTLQTLDLEGTQVSDVTPLAGLTALQMLHLGGTPVSDVTPLAGLTALQILHLEGTQVSDVTPLASLTALQTLTLVGTQVSDVTPLASLIALRMLTLEGTQVSDVTPLASLTALRMLELTRRVSDVTPLARLIALQTLNLEGTQVSDVTPLSGLTALQMLTLEGRWSAT